MHGGELVDVSAFLLALLILIIGAKVGAEVAERVGQPSVLGEILAGILIGATGFGLITHISTSGGDFYHVLSLSGETARGTHSALNALAEVGVIILLFEIGLHSDLYELRKVGKSALWVGFAGVILPMVGGYFASRWFLHLDFYQSLFIGAALTATSVGITARVFQDMKLLHTAESQVVLGAAVADDVIGLVILAVVAALIPTPGTPAISGSAVWLEGIKVTLFAVGFLIVAIVVGVRFVPTLERGIAATKSRGGITVAGITFCLLIAIVGQAAGLAMIVGAFAAGLVLSHSEVKTQIQESIKPIADIFIPLFFAMTGTAINLRVLGNGFGLIQVTLILTVVAVVGKVIGSMTVPDKSLSKWVVGLAMIPRGEVGLIYARLGIQNGWIKGVEADGLIMMVMATTLMTPPLLRGAVVKLKRQRGELETLELERSTAPLSDSGFNRENWEAFGWEVFDVDAMLTKESSPEGQSSQQTDSHQPDSQQSDSKREVAS